MVVPTCETLFIRENDVGLLAGRAGIVTGGHGCHEWLPRPIQEGRRDTGRGKRQGGPPLPVIRLWTPGNALFDAFGTSVPQKMRQMVHFDISCDTFRADPPARMRPWRISGAVHQLPVRRNAVAGRVLRRDGVARICSSLVPVLAGDLAGDQDAKRTAGRLAPRSNGGLSP